MRPVILGVDPSVKRLGLAAICLETGHPLQATSSRIDERDGGWLHQQIKRALADFVRPEWEPTILAIEDPTFAARGKSQARQWGEVMAYAESEARSLWPHIITGEAWRLPIGTWKAKIGVGGNAKAPIYVPHIVHELAWPIPKTHEVYDVDAAAAAGVATAAYRINAEAFE